ncbi:MAG: ABC transporter substrate-binding protein, partial [Mycolicibacterium fortuitum]
PSTGEPTASADVLRIGYQSASDYGLFYLAQEEGWFEKAGLKVELSLFDSGDAQIEALAGGSIDVTLQGAQPPLLAMQRGTADIRLLGPIADSAGLFSIVASSDIHSVKDLKGKKVAVTAGTAYDFYLDNVLEKFGMAADSVQKIDLQPLDGQGSFLSQQVDAVVPLATSRYLILDKVPDANVIFASGDFEKDPNPSTFSLYDLMVTTSQVTDAKADALQKLVDVFYGTVIPYVQDAKNHDELVKKLYDWQANVLKAPTSEKDVAAQIDSYGFYDVERAKKAMSSGEFTEQITAQANFLVSTGKLPSLPAITDMTDTPFISQMK